MTLHVIVIVCYLLLYMTTWFFNTSPPWRGLQCLAVTGSGSGPLPRVAGNGCWESDLP